MKTQIDNLYKPLSQFIKKRISNREDAEDLTQEVFYKLVKSDDSAMGSVKSWVYAVAKNTIVDYYRKKRIATNELDEQVFREEELADVVHELSSCIAPFIDQLPDEYRQVLQLSELKRIPQKEIAKQLDINYTTLRSKIQRGRKKLKVLISECCHVEQGVKGSIVQYKKKSSCATKSD
ncbi:sigma-70 family RNA polymerase sigma factor [Reichenbachiella sp.]|uniref:sigma-70 family RNA polymerase sigma factor n=1 Tax=Reichenbachiella sp. TaxID=2184521 RepID=UPI003BB0A2AC